MENASYVTLTRQSGLLNELRVVANNIANQSTTGFRQEGVMFSEYVQRLDGQPSLSMARGNVRATSFLQGTLSQTDAPLDVALDGDGFFLIETPEGERLTRSGAFTTNATGELVTHDGRRVLDEGASPLFIPPDARSIAIAPDGTISADGAPVGRLGVVIPNDPNGMLRESGTLFRADAGYEPAEAAHVAQGFLEASNVDVIDQVARLVEVQRAYEMGQKFLDAEDERIRNAVKTLTR